MKKIIDEQSMYYVDKAEFIESVKKYFAQFFNCEKEVMDNTSVKVRNYKKLEVTITHKKFSYTFFPIPLKIENNIIIEDDNFFDATIIAIPKKP